MGVTSAVQTAMDDADDTATEVADDNGAKALAGALGSITNPSTTEEAKGYARKFLNRELSSNEQEGESEIMSGLEKNASAARSALQKARESLLNLQAQQQQNAQKDRWLAAAQAFGAPTKSGSFFENLGDYAGIERKRRAEELSQQAEFNRQNLGLDTEEAGVDQPVLQARLALQKLHEQLAGTMGKESLNILGRQALNPKQPGGAPMSVEGKEAMDEGLTPGTPAFTARVHDLVTKKNAALAARAGIDTSGTPTDTATTATTLGVPANVPDPWAGMPTRTRLAAQAAEQRNGQKQLDTYPAVDAQTQNALRMVDEFEALNAKTHTGPELGAMRLSGGHAGLHGVGAELGQEHGLNINPLSWAPSFNSNIQRMDKIANNLVGLAIPEKGFGRVTNLDMGVFQRGMLSVERNRATNSDIAKALRIRLQNDLDRHEYEQNYFQTYGHLRGAEAAWNKYLNDNPIFDPKTAKSANPSLNPNRQRYDEYFRQKNGGGVTEADRNDPALQGLTDEEIAAAKRPAHARGGRAFAEGGDVDAEQGQSDYQNALEALKRGASYKMASGHEDPEAHATNLAGETLGAGGVAAALLALSRLGRRVGLGDLAKVVAEHPTVASSVAGGGAGALAGAASNPGDPVNGAIGYGVTGAALGPLARFGIHGATDALGRLSDRLSGQTVNAGDRRVIGALQADNPSLGDISARLQADAKARVPSTLADAAGPRTQGLAAAALAKDTPETQHMAEKLSQRQEGANARVQEKVNQALAPDPYDQKLGELTTALYTNADPLYQQAYKAFPGVQSKSLMELMNTPAGQEAAQRAVLKMQNLQKPIGAVNPVTDMVMKPSLEYLDYVKRAFDDMIRQEEGSGPNRVATDDGHILRQMRDKLVNELDTVTRGPGGQPGPYQAARAQYKGDLEVRDALRSGNEEFKNATPAQLQAAIQGMSFAEKDAFKSGVAEYLFQRLNNTTDTQNPAQRIINTPGLREKLSVIFDKPAEANRFLQGIEREAQVFDQSKPMLGAAKRGAAQSQVPPSLAQMARTTLMRPETAGQITNTLGSVGPEAQAAMTRLRASADRLRQRSDIGNLAGVAGAAGLGAGITPSDQPGAQ